MLLSAKVLLFSTDLFSILQMYFAVGVTDENFWTHHTMTQCCWMLPWNINTDIMKGEVFGQIYEPNLQMLECMLVLRQKPPNLADIPTLGFFKSEKIVMYFF
jgi:hypothetical protein